MRISLDALPPRTGRSCTSTTFAPCRAAERAAHTPLKPPPQTTNCVSIATSFTTREFASVSISSAGADKMQMTAIITPSLFFMSPSPVHS